METEKKISDCQRLGGGGGVTTGKCCKTTLYDYVIVIDILCIWQNPQNYITQRLNPNVNYELELIILYQYQFVVVTNVPRQCKC